MCKQRTQNLHHPSRSPAEKSEKDSSCLANASLATSFLFEARAKETTSPRCTGAKPWTCPTLQPTTPSRTRRKKRFKETRSRQRRNHWVKMACTLPLLPAPPSPPPAQPSPWAFFPSSGAAGGEWGTAECRPCPSLQDDSAAGSRVFLEMLSFAQRIKMRKRRKKMSRRARC